MNDPNLVQPHISVLSAEQVERVHDYSLRILSTTGVRVDSEPAQRIFARALGAAQVDGDRVRIPPELVAWAIDAAPASVDIFDRLGNPLFRLGEGGGTHFGIGVTTLYYQDPLTDRVLPFAREHMALMSRLGQALPSFDAISTVGIVQDVAPELSDLYGTLDMIANTTKALVLLVSDEGAFPAVLDMLEHLRGQELGRQPFVLPYFNPVSPLVLNQGTADKMLATIERGLPFIFSNYGMAGATTPITPGGALVLLNAELLAGLVFSQLVREGAPIILGSLPAYFDMKTMVSFYEPRSFAVDLACAEMMAHYHLPHCGTSGSGVGWGPDLLAAGAYWINHLTSCIGKVGLAPFVGDNLTSKAISPVTVVYADEVISQARLFAQGFALDDAAVALDEIAQVGPGGHFLMSGQTLKLFRNAYFRSPIFPTLSMEEWEARDCPQAVTLLRDYTRQLLEAIEPPEDHADLLARGEVFIGDRIAR